MGGPHCTWHCRFRSNCSLGNLVAPCRVSVFVCLDVINQAWHRRVGGWAGCCRGSRSETIEFVFVFPFTIRDAQLCRVIRNRSIIVQSPAGSRACRGQNSTFVSKVFMQVLCMCTCEDLWTYPSLG